MTAGSPTPPSTTPPQKAALSRELGEFLIELSIALHKHAMYPEGHPSLAPAAAGVARRAGDLLQERPTLSLGVARNQLIIEGVATDPKEFDPELVKAFTGMMRKWDSQVAVLTDEKAALPMPGSALPTPG